MKFLLIILSTLLLFYYVSAEEKSWNLTCNELKHSFVGSIFYGFSSLPKYEGANFYLATKNDDDGVKIGENNWSGLNGDAFDPSRKTYFIIHGYIANHKRPYILDMKNKLLETNNINIIVIDWSIRSKTWNYINAAQSTYKVAEDIIKFLQNMKTEVAKLNKPGNVWNNLYFIGHSLGAHISGQTGRLIKKEHNFFKVERITGLDPAQPCFKDADESLKLDKSDADFVDIIHTQTGNGDGINAFGLQQPIGHIDFYVNGGVMQPECETKSIFYTKINKMICSHNLANNIYADSVANSKSKDCKFVGRSWDGTYLDGLRILYETEKGGTCSDCPEMGLNAVKYKTKNRRYLVFVSVKQPYCQLKNDDSGHLRRGLAKLNSPTVLFPDTKFDPEDFMELGY